MEKFYVTVRIKTYGGYSDEDTEVELIHVGSDRDAALAAIDEDYEKMIQNINGESDQCGEDSYLIDEDEDAKITYKILDTGLIDLKEVK